ncbi:MAG: DUF4388 domain-containing protein [candidate division Zixibacteria bacterium]|nr:DUF4388 domain-containing protein [candidate division Zixibacteria bacterium]
MRLDQILMMEGLVTEDQVKEALRYQKEYGGKLGSHLLRRGYIHEAGLVRALAKQYRCDGVVLSAIDIPDLVIRFISAKVAVSRMVVPFDYDPEDNTLKVACDDPHAAGLIEELDFVARGKIIKLYVAAEIALKSVIAERYLPRLAQASPQPPGTEISASAEGGFNDSVPLTLNPQRMSILLVTDDPQADNHLRGSLEHDQYQVKTADSADEAMDLMSGRQFDTVFIRDTVQGDYLDLIDRLRKSSPRTSVRYYESMAGLLLQNMDEAQIDLHLKSLHLFTSILSSKDNRPGNHSGTVGLYAERLCKQMGLPAKDRLVIATAGYLHDLAKTYYGSSESPEDSRDSILLTVKLLDSLNYSPVVIGILKKMYINLHDKYQKRLPIEALGGNILTIIDIFCDNIPTSQKMSLDKFDVLSAKLKALVGKLFLTEVVESFITLIQSDLLISPPRGRFNQVMIFCEDVALGSGIENKLRKEGFRAVVQHAPDNFGDLFERGRPDMMVLAQHGEPSVIHRLIDSFADRGIELASIPVFLLVDHWMTPHLTSIFKRGIEDLLPLDNSYDLLVAKMTKVQSRLESGAQTREDHHDSTGSIGNIESMNLIDLLQALGPSRKSVRITLLHDSKELVIFLNQGEIVHAHGCGKFGAEAVYEGIAFTKGFWSTQPVKPEEIPERNTSAPNESILMEGCRRLDEESHLWGPHIPTKIKT